MPTITLTDQGDVLDQTGLSNDGLIDTIYGGLGDDSILGDGQNLNDLEGDLIYGGDGVDTLAGAFGDNTIFGGAGDDVLDNSAVTASSGVDTVSGDAGNDSIFGTRRDDLIYGGDGNDIIDSNEALFTGAAGLAAAGDTVFGGAGDDIITTISSANTAVSSSIGDLVYGGAGNDSILGAFENPNGDPTNPTPGIDPSIDDDLLYGGAGNDTIDGNGGTDFIYGGEGDDLVISADDADTTDGGAGIDTISFENEAALENAAVVFNMVTGATTVTGSTGADVELNINYENATGGRLADTINGNDAENIIIGGAGADLLTGGLGSDTFISGTGDDSINGDELSTSGNDDIDVIDYSGETAGVVVTYTGDEAGTAQGVSTGTDTFENIERLIFSAEDDSVNAAADNAGLTIDTGAGDDFVEAGGAADSLDGGDGVDTLSYTDSAEGVTVDLEAGTGSGGAAEGDTFVNFENVQLSGNDDSVVTSAGVDTVQAGDGDDTVGGSAGPDSLDGGDGVDTLDYSASAEPVTIDLAAGTVAGGDAEGDTVANFEGASGTVGNDTLLGDDAGNTFDGGAGDDSISTGAGDDSVDGGDGNDDVDLGDGDDTAVTGAGNDTVVTGEGGDSVSTGEGNDFIVGDGGDVVDGGGTSVGNDINNPIPGDFDTLSVSDVPPGGSFVVNRDAADPENGTVDILDAGGNVVRSIVFTEIERIVCFTRGTMIATPSGDVAIEDLSEGDMVLTRDNGAQPIRWMGSKALAAQGKLAPVMIKAGALGNDRDLLVSQLHRMLVTDWRAELMFGEAEVLATAKHLVNGDTIYVAEGGEVEYFHMLFDNHEIVTANGAPSESFHPGEQGMGWLEEEMREEIFAIFPELRVELDGYGPAARMSLKGFEARALKR